MRSFFARSALQYFGAIAGIFAFLGSLYLALDLFFGEDWIRLHSLPILTHGFYWLLILLLLWLILSYKPKSFISAPRVRRVFEDGLILADGEEWLGINVAVSIYVSEGDFEKLVCSGEVVNMQSNGLAQIQAQDGLEDDFIATLRTSSHGLLIKPGIRK